LPKVGDLILIPFAWPNPMSFITAKLLLLIHIPQLMGQILEPDFWQAFVSCLVINSRSETF
jgi:hypothetical protein